MKALYALCLSLAAFAFARPAQAELKYLSYEVQSGTVKELTAEEVEKLDVTDKRWHETISTTTEDGTQTKTTEMLFVQDTDISTEYYIGVFEVTQAQANLLKLGNATGTYGYAYGVAYSNTGFPFATTPTLNNKPGLSFPTPDQWLAYASGTNRSLATSPQSATNLRGGGSLSSFYSLTEWYDYSFKWRTGANIHGVIDIFGNAAEYTCDPGKGEDGSDIVAFYGWPTYHGSDYSWKKLEELTSPSETRLDAYNSVGNITDIWGARLVYTVPAARTYTLTVTLDGTEVSKQEGLNEGTSVTVTPPTPAEWHRLSGCTITPPQENLQPPTGEALERPYTFQMPAADLTFAYTSEPYGTITVEGGTAKVTHGEVAVEGTQVVVGDTVTLTARDPAAYERFTGWTVTKGEGEPTPIEPTTDEETQESVYSYTIPALQGGETFAFTAHFEKIPYATITVKNGHAEVNGETVTEVVNEQEVTLVANAPGEHQCFTDWVVPEGIEVTDNRFKVSGLTGQGETLAFEAKIQTYPFVRVFGGTVGGTEDGRDDGEGYYYPGTTLNLNPSGLDGYTHTGWSVTVNGTETESSLQGDSYTIPANTYDVSIAITALYKAPTEPGQVEPGTGATIRLGYADTEGTKAYDLFGSEVAADVKLDDGYGNVYAFPGYTPAGAIATFDLTDNTISYGEPAADAGEQPSLVGYEGTYAEFWRKYMEWWQKAYGTESTSYSNDALTLRRVTRATDDPYDDFYLGVYETSIANVAYLQKLCLPDAKNLAFLDGKTGDAKPYCFNLNVSGFTPTEREELFDAGFDVSKLPALVGKAFGVTVTVPSKSDLIAVAGTPPTDNPNAGRGASKDTEIKTGMVVHLNNNTVKTVHGMDPDPYGFYGIWGSRWEYIGGTVAVGGAWNTGWEQCHVDKVADGLNWSRPSGLTYDVAFRPKVAVEKPVTVTVQYRVGEATTEIGTVEVAPGKPLFADFEKATPVRAGYTFLRWELDGKALTANPTLAADQTTATLTAVWEESSVFVEFEYVNCMGPSVGYPGQTICVYPPEGRQFVPHSHAIDMSAEDEDAIVEDFIWPGWPDLGMDGEDYEDGSERFVLKTSFTVTEPVTITGTLEPIEEPEPEVKPGYRFRLR